MQSEQLTERKWKGNQTVFLSLALGNANLAALHINLSETNRHQFAYANPRIEQRFDQHHIGEVAAVPDGLVKTAHVLLARDLRQPCRTAGNLDFQLLAECSEDAFEIRVVHAFSSKVLRQFSGLFLGWGPVSHSVCLLTSKDALRPGQAAGSCPAARSHRAQRAHRRAGSSPDNP